MKWICVSDAPCRCPPVWLDYLLIRDLLKPPNELHTHVNSMITNCLPDEDDDDDEG